MADDGKQHNLRNKDEESPLEHDVAEAESLLLDSPADKTQGIRSGEQSAKLNDTGGSDYLPEADYLFSEAQEAQPDTAAQRYMEHRKNAILDNNSAALTTDEEALRFERERKRES